MLELPVSREPAITNSQGDFSRNVICDFSATLANSPLCGKHFTQHRLTDVDTFVDTCVLMTLRRSINRGTVVCLSLIRLWTRTYTSFYII